MKLRTIVGAVVLSGFVTPALAHGKHMDLYVVQDAATKKCTVTKMKPKDSSLVIVSPADTEYHNVDEANAAMKVIPGCS